MAFPLVIKNKKDINSYTLGVKKQLETKLNFHIVMFLPYRRVAVGRDPNTGEVISVDFVLYKLPPPLLVDVDASRLAVMDLAAHHCGVGVGLHLEARYTVSMDVTVLKVTLKHTQGSREDVRSVMLRHMVKTTTNRPMCTYHAVIEGEHADISSVVDVVTSNDGIAVVFHPNSC